MTRIIESRRRFKSRLDAKQDVSRPIPALMGDGAGVIDVPNQPGYVYIRVGDGDLGQAFNNRVPRADNLAIDVGYDPITDPDRRIFQVLSVRMADYAGGGSTIYPNIPNHHESHEFGGGDDVFLSWRRLMGLRVGRPSGFSITVDEGFILRAGAWLAVLAQTLDLTASKPALATQARYVLIALNAAGVATSTDGALVAVGALDISDCPIPAAGEIPLAAVRIYGTQTSIGDTPSAPDIIDLRFPQAASTGTVFLSSLQPGTAQYQIITSGANPYPATWSGFYVRGTAGGTTNLLVANTKTLQLSAQNDFTLTAMRTGEILVYNIAAANIFADTTANARGAGAIDWQLVRTVATQVAGADYTVIIGGRYNTVTGQDSTAGGYYTSVTHTGCFLWADPTVAGFASIVNNEFAIQATGGFRVAYNNTNYAQVTVSAAGVTTFNATGASAGFAFSDVVTLPAAGLVVTGMARGDLLTGNATPAFARLAKGTANAVVTCDANDTLWSTYFLSGTAGGTTNFAVTNTKTLTLTATNDYNLTIPATGTAALLAIANVFTAIQEINLNAAALPADMAGTVFHIGGADAAFTRILFDSFGDASVVTGRRANNTAASPQALTSGIAITGLQAAGYGATAYTDRRAAIYGVTSEAWTDAANGCRWDIYTTPNGSTTMGLAAQIGQDKSLKVVGAFGCNAATPQTAYASGGALNAYGAGANGLDTGANMSALHAMVVKIRAALVANGIMS